VVFTFATNIAVDPDNNPDNNSFKISFDARVLDEATNELGVSLENSASLQVSDGPVEESNTVTVDILEPRIETAKGVSPVTGVEAGTLCDSQTPAHQRLMM